MDFGTIEGIFEGANHLYLYIDDRRIANWLILYQAHIVHALRVHLSHFAPSRDVWFGHNKYFM